MLPMMSDEEAVLRRLPLPLAQLYRRASNAATALERHQAFWYCWEAAIKLLGSSVVLEFAERPTSSAQHRERLQSLARPSLGHWWGYCHTFLPLLAGSDPGPSRSSTGCSWDPPAATYRAPRRWMRPCATCSRAAGSPSARSVCATCSTA